MRTIKYIFLPILGVLAAVIAFGLAAPYVGTLTRPNLPAEDPRALFTWGTQWGAVNRIVFGAMLCGPFAVVLTMGRRSWPRVALAGVFGFVLGGAVNFATDSGSDLIGLSLAGYDHNLGGLVAMMSWCVLVPTGVALTLVFVQGLTRERLRRAHFAIRWAAVASFGVQIVGGMLAAQHADAEGALASQIPVWRLVEIAVGLALGLTLVVADEYVRAGTIRLILGRNEVRDWSLDHEVNRIGSSEGCEIPLFGIAGVQPEHAWVVRQGDGFFIDPKAETLVNGQVAGQRRLQDGDRITVGSAELAFSLRGGVWVAPTVMAPSYPAGQVPVQPMPVPMVQSTFYAPHTPGSGPVVQTTQSTQPAQVRTIQDSGGRPLPLPIGRYAVGREPTNAICLRNDPTVMRQHAELVVTPAGLDLVPLPGSGTTRVNGVPITNPSELVPGDVIEFGASKFTYTG